MLDEDLKKFISKLNKKLNINNILKAFEEILWYFNDDEIMIEKNMLLASQKNNKRSFLKIIISNNLIELELKRKGNKLILMINSDNINFTHQKIQKVNNNKIIAINELKYDIEGNFISQNDWCNILYKTKEKKGCLKKVGTILKNDTDLYCEYNVLATNNCEGKNFRTEEKISKYNNIEIPNLMNNEINLLEICNGGITKLFNMSSFLKTINEDEILYVKKLNF